MRVAHREFFKNALADKAIPGLEVNFASINFSSRDSVLGTAKAFEDLGVSAYNGAGKLITSPDYLLLAGKIVSVEARHAALIRDLISNGSFADNTVIDANGLDMAKAPQRSIGNGFFLPEVEDQCIQLTHFLKHTSMNIHHIITEVEKVDPEIYDRLNPRRKVIQQFANLGGKLALAAVPLALGGLFSKAYGRGTTGSVLDVLTICFKAGIPGSRVLYQGCS